LVMNECNSATAVFNPKTFILIQEHCPYTRTSNSEKAGEC